MGISRFAVVFFMALIPSSAADREVEEHEKKQMSLDVGLQQMWTWDKKQEKQDAESETRCGDSKEQSPVQPPPGPRIYACQCTQYRVLKPIKRELYDKAMQKEIKDVRWIWKSKMYDECKRLDFLPSKKFGLGKLNKRVECEGKLSPRDENRNRLHMLLNGCLPDRGEINNGETSGVTARQINENGEYMACYTLKEDDAEYDDAGKSEVAKWKGVKENADGTLFQHLHPIYLEVSWRTDIGLKKADTWDSSCDTDGGPQCTSGGSREGYHGN